MRTTLLACVLTLIAGIAHAQNTYGPGAPSDCYYKPPLGMMGTQLFANSIMQHSDACMNYQEEQRQLRAAYDQAQQANRAQVARQALAAQQQAQEIERRDQEARRQNLLKEAATRMIAQQAAQRAAETSPENICRRPDMARELLTAFNTFSAFKKIDIYAVDIEHLTTTSKPGDYPDRLSCHGSFVLNRDGNARGTLTFRKNVAGDDIKGWVPG